MIGKKLNLLLKELTTSQAKILLYKSTLSNDKRFQILKSLISIRQIDEDEINDFLQKQINLNWKFVSEKENQLKSFIDSTRQYTRISAQMADLGSIKTKKIIAQN